MKPLIPDDEKRRIEEDWSLFWANRLSRPMVCMEFLDPAAPPDPAFNRYFQAYPESLSPAQVIEIETRRLYRTRFLGDALPKRFLNFGAGSLASYLGSPVEVRPDTIWFHPVGKPIHEIAIQADPGNYWVRRAGAIRDAAPAAWGDKIQLSVSDLGGNLDILASLRGTEDLLMDMLEDPDRVERLTREITREWIKAYNGETARLTDAGLGVCPWAPIWSKEKCYMLQCDLSYMFSSAMFERFVLPDLDACCDHIPASFYHLDGKGALKHLDALLGIPKLKGIQWIPGAGQPEASEWPEVLDKIRKAGKFCQIGLSPDKALELKKSRDLTGFVIQVNLPDPAATEDAERLYRELTS